MDALSNVWLVLNPQTPQQILLSGDLYHLKNVFQGMWVPEQGEITQLSWKEEAGKDKT